MRLFIENDEHFRFLWECITKKPSEIMISTYNVYLGITGGGKDMTTFGPNHQSQSRDILEMVKTKDKSNDVKIMIGTYDYRSCKGAGSQCINCEKKYVMGLFKIQNHAEKFPEFDFRVSTKSHAKFTLFGYKDGSMRGVAGGRNFADSVWADATMELDTANIETLCRHFNGIWETSKAPDTKWIESVIRDQGISQEAIKALDNEASI